MARNTWPSPALPQALPTITTASHASWAERPAQLGSSEVKQKADLPNGDYGKVKRQPENETFTDNAIRFRPVFKQQD